jgi:zinc and cadmium transporter
MGGTILGGVLAVMLAVAGSVGGLITASALLAVGEPVRQRVVPWLVSFAVGTLLGAALLALAPEALESLEPVRVFSVLLAGILTFFLLEKVVLWRHEHEHGVRPGSDQGQTGVRPGSDRGQTGVRPGSDQGQTTQASDGHLHLHTHRSAASLIIIGDALHTFVDGAVIAAAVLVSPSLGVTTAVAIAAHEIPQEAGDFAILLAAGYSRNRALLLNITSAAGGVLGALTMLLFGEQAPHALPYILAFASGNFLYVAMADLIPTLHHGALDRNVARQLILIGLGIAAVALL